VISVTLKIGPVLIGVPVLDPQTLCGQQRLTLSGIDVGLQCLVGGIQPLVRCVSLSLYALDDFECGGFFTARLEAGPSISASAGSVAITARTGSTRNICLTT
jgi:hypothetical protein